VTARQTTTRAARCGDESGRILDGVTLESADEEIAEAVVRRDAEDARSRAVLRRIGVSDGVGRGWTSLTGAKHLRRRLRAPRTGASIGLQRDNRT
jgi:hypothetical protein